MRNPLLLLLLNTATNAYFDPERSFSQKMKIALNNFLLDQFDMDVIRTEVKVSFRFRTRCLPSLEPVHLRLAQH